MLDASYGSDGAVVSNHGGRQTGQSSRSTRWRRSAPPSDPGVEIVLDSGIMSGGDIAAGLAAGADFTMIGRAYLYGLMAGGQQGASGPSTSCTPSSGWSCSCSA